MDQLFSAHGGAHEHSLLARQDNTGDNTFDNGSTFFCPTPVDIQGPSCVESADALLGILIMLLLVAVAAIIILSALQRRVKLCPRVCWGYPGLAVPVNMLDPTPFRIIYTIIFGIMSNAAITTVVSGPPQFWTPPESKIAQAILGTFSRLLYVLMLSFFYYPLLASVDSGIPVVGFSVGAVYSILLFLLKVMTLVIDYNGCTTGCEAEPIVIFIQLLGNIPSLLYYIAVILWFVSRFILEIYRLIKSPKPFLIKIREKPEVTYYENRVRILLKSVRAQDNPGRLRKILNKVYFFDKGFQFPLRFLIAVTVTFFIVLEISTQVLISVIIFAGASGFFRTFILNSYSGFNLTEIISPTSLQQVYNVVNALIGTNISVAVINASSIQEQYLDVAVRITADSFLGLAVIIPIGTLVAIGFVFFMLFLMYRSVGGNIRSASKGDLSFLSLERPPLYRSLDASIKYIGYQIAYFFWALLLYLTITIIGGSVVVLGGIVLYIFPSIIGNYILPLLVGFLWSQVIFWGQIFICWLFFTKKDGDLVYIHNRRLYNWVAYILLFQNAFVGFFSAIFRILKSALFGLIIVSRLDRVLYMKGFERFDSAHRTFVGFVTLDLALNNSVMHVFCKLLLEKRQLCDSNSSGSDNEAGKFHLMRESDSPPIPGIQQGHFHSQRAYNRWMKAYTLLKNPSLIETTGRKLEEKKLQSSLAFPESIVEMVTL